MTDNLISRIEYQSSSRDHLIGSVCGLEVKCNFIFKFYEHYAWVDKTELEGNQIDDYHLKKGRFGGKNFDQNDDDVAEVKDISSPHKGENVEKSFRKNQTVAKHPYISLGSIPNMYIGGNDGHILLFWLDLCCIKFFQRKISTSTLSRRVPGQIGNDHYIFDFLITKRSEEIPPSPDEEESPILQGSENGKKKKSDLRHFLILNISGSKIAPASSPADPNPEPIFSTEFDEENAYFLMQILKKANQVFSP
jgi:hypothetical protein